MKKVLCLLLTVFILFAVTACAGNIPGESEPTEELTIVRETITVSAEDLPVVYDDKSSYLENGGIELNVPETAAEVTQLILYNEICQVQFMYEDVLYTYRACVCTTGRSGSALTGIDESVNYLPDTVVLPTDFSATAIEGHLLTGNGALLLWEDGVNRYSLAAADCSFEKLCDTARLVF